ncbi:MAG: sugar transferase [Christensenella sp.]|nr:sugar transferase [Christensenella sp.]
MRNGKNGFYCRYEKRGLDFLLSVIALIVLSPIMLILTIIGAIIMKGNPFFIQPRPGKNEKIFNLIKFRTMTCEKDEFGKLLPDDKRLVSYGKFLRSTSLDELPELINIIKGEMAIVGPRPLLVKYLILYTEEQSHRHNIRPGLTGYAQVHGRNSITWADKFELDIWYVDNMSFKMDVEIILETVRAILTRKGISSQTSATMEEFAGIEENVKAETK